MINEQFAVLIEFGAEQRHVEYKGPGRISDKHLVHKLVRAIIGMTNRPNGGYIVIGVNEDNGVLVPVGIEDTIIARWTRDSLADKVAPMVDPSVDFDLEHCTYEGRQFVLITVREFDETPAFCRVTTNDASNKVVLREGALYVRGRRKPETIEIRTAQEMRDLLELALRKRLRHFTELLQASGISSASGPHPSDADKFAAQAADLEL